MNSLKTLNLILSSSKDGTKISCFFSRLAKEQLAIRLKQSFGKFWRSFVVDECPDEKLDRLQGHGIYSQSAAARAVSVKAPLPSYHHAGFFRVSIAAKTPA
jgi:hypothetical protein